MRITAQTMDKMRIFISDGPLFTYKFRIQDRKTQFTEYIQHVLFTKPIVVFLTSIKEKVSNKADPRNIYFTHVCTNR